MANTVHLHHVQRMLGRTEEEVQTNVSLLMTEALFQVLMASFWQC